MFTLRFFRRQSFDIPCRLEIEHTNEYLKAHVDIGDVQIGPGDAVQVHNAPTDIRFGERVVCFRRATITRAVWIDRLWARWSGARNLPELYDLSFTSRRNP